MSQPERRKRLPIAPERMERARERLRNRTAKIHRDREAKLELAQPKDFMLQILKPQFINLGKDAELASLALTYYQHHYQQMRALVNESSAIVWGSPHDPRDYAKLYGFFSQRFLSRGVYIVPPDKDHPPDPSVFQHSPFIYWDVCMAARAFAAYNNNSDFHNDHGAPTPRPHVLFTHLNENWGALSEEIVNKTADWMPDLQQKWMAEQCTQQLILDYLDHPQVRAVVTTQHQILQHSKVHSLPLGIVTYEFLSRQLLRILYNYPPPTLPENSTSTNSSTNNTSLHMEQENCTVYHPNVTLQDPRPILLMISSSDIPARTHIYNTVIRTFAEHGVMLKNTYNSNRGYAKELRRSKFILSPYGLGIDCYRHWEAITMGTIPVIEHLNRTETDGWFRTLQDLPVALIDSYDNLTPLWLENEYRRIMSRPPTSHKFEKLTSNWWINLIQSNLVKYYEP
jgi:hypothetical protein